MQINIESFNLDKELETIFQEIVTNAKQIGFNIISETFILKILLETPAFIHYLESKEIDIPLFNKKITEQLKVEQNEMSQLAFADNMSPNTIKFTEVFVAVILKAKELAKYREQNFAKLHNTSVRPIVTSAIDLILAMNLVPPRGCFVRTVLKEMNISQESVASFFSDIVTGKEKEADKKSAFVPQELQAYLSCLNETVSKNEEFKIVGREKEIERMIQILGRKKKNNPLIIGDEGVGKTALVEGVAYKINTEEVPSSLKDSKLFSLDIGALVAGTKFRGDFEERLKKVLTFIQSSDKHMLFIDEIHTICGAGANSDKATDMGNQLKPALAKSLKCIGATTYKEYKSHIEKDGALARRFQKLDIAPPSPAETVEILHSSKDHYAKFHNVSYAEGVVELIVNLANKYIANKNFPDKAIDILDEVSVLTKHSNRTVVEKRDVQHVVASMSNIDINSLVAEDNDLISQLHTKLSTRVIDQENAVEKVCETIYLDRAGLLSHDKPKGVFLFSGPTGVGKTETAKALADAMNMKLIRIDMSEFKDQHASSKLVGTTAGYVGYDDGGILTTAVSKSPYSVVLLDEVEKAHPSIFTLLLQIFDYGFIKDGQGREVDFRNTIIIMTTNVGVSQAEASSSKIGFMSADTDSTTEHIENALKDQFAPEFRGRLSAIVTYKSLSKEHMQKIMQKFINQIVERVKEKGIELTVTESMKEYLLSKGFSAKLGARPLEIALRDNVQVPLSKAILFDNLKTGAKVSIAREDDSNVVSLIKELETV